MVTSHFIPDIPFMVHVIVFGLIEVKSSRPISSAHKVTIDFPLIEVFLRGLFEHLAFSLCLHRESEASGKSTRESELKKKSTTCSLCPAVLCTKSDRLREVNAEAMRQTAPSCSIHAEKTSFLKKHVNKSSSQREGAVPAIKRYPA